MLVLGGFATVATALGRLFVMSVGASHRPRPSVHDPCRAVDVVVTITIMPDLEWDDDNLAHFARHGITYDEVYEVFEGPTLRQRGGTDAPDRFRVLGRTAAGRYLTILYQDKKAGLLRPFTGWDMLPHERRLYDRQT